jgi:hypothetical protein
MIGRHDKHQRSRITAYEPFCRRSDSRSCSPGYRLHQQSLKFHLASLRLRPDEKSMLIVGHHDRLTEPGLAFKPLEGLLQKGVLAR